MQKILIIDDEEDLLELTKYNLEKEGFAVSTSLNGEEGIELAKKTRPDLILLDIMMPRMDGMEVCYELRKIPALNNTIIVFFTARSEDYSQLEGFKSGADAYLTKPIRPKVLTANIKAMLKRRLIETAETRTDTIGRICIDRAKRLVYDGDKKIVLTKMEFNLLTFLTSRPGDLFSREQIFDTLWGADSGISDRTIDVHIRKLREKIGDACIETMKGVGYKYNENY